MPAQPLRVPFVCKPPSLRCGLEPAILRRVLLTDFWSPRLSGDHDPSYFSLRIFFHQLQYDEEFAPYYRKKNLPNVFPHSIIHIRDKEVLVQKTCSAA
jgi:hypothetical protein